MLNSIFGDLSLALDASTSASLTAAIQSVYGFLTDFAKREDFFDKSEFVFGKTLDRGVLGALREQWVSGDFSKLPDLKLLSASDLQGANAAFAGSTGEIYLSTGFLSQNVSNPQVLAAVLLEEVGHSVDWKVNAVDTVGDEGELFSAVLRGVDLSPAQVQQIKQENDSVVLNLGGALFDAEKADNVQLNFANNFDGYKVLEKMIEQRGQTKALFMNGVFTEDSWGMFESQYKAVSETLKITSSDPLSSIKFDYEYNPSFLPSVSELATSIGIGIAGAIISGGSLTIAAIQSAISRVVAGLAVDAGETLYQILSDDLTISNLINEKDGGLNDRVREWINTQNNSLIFLPHSQGNLFIEDSLKVVNPNPDITTHVPLVMEA